ncbi:TrbI/VirB10 family protein [Brasilonema sp. UFV-L1]|uniref:TrbI/VirB10 family protein n=1 Tax=Brasilonema sp. UFV-L1 TaxID=2234130 RepID=UPI00145DABC4|nr:TrbI/VirB10 family protein [Brasilonema sp. UFV-L1]NMG10305.1 hypothetical protein [Brasilonema sp. UFV-L1]
MNNQPKSNNNSPSQNKYSEPESKVHNLHEVPQLDWHERMANLVGLEEETPPSNKEKNGSETASQTPDETPAQPSHPSSQRTKQPLSSNPFAKVGLVGAATLSVVLVAGAFLSQLMSGTNKTPQKNFPQITRKNEADKIEQIRPEEEIEILKTKLALAEQAKAVKTAQLQLKTVKPPTQAKPTPAQPKPRTQTVTRVVVQRVPTPAQTVYVPRVVERIVRVPQRVVVQARPTVTQPTQPPQPIQRIQPTQRPQPIQTPQPTPTPSISPVFELSIPGLSPQDIAQIPFSLSIPSPTPTPSFTPTPTPTPTATPTPSLPRVASSPPSRLGSELNSRDRETTDNPSTSALINRLTQHSSKSIAVGTKAKAVLATAVFGEGSRPGTNNNNDRNNNNNNNNKNDSTFVVRLKEPLKSIDGAVALPANTELLTQIQQLSDGGMMQLKVVSVISQNKGKLTEISLPESAMKVRAPNGRPLLAKKYPDKSGKISGMDTFIFGLGGAGKIGEILNRPETKFRTYDCGTSGNNTCAYTETRQQRNIPAAVLEGGMNALVPQLNNRNNQAINELIQKSNIWYLPVGTEVEVFANQITRFSETPN